MIYKYMNIVIYMQFANIIKEKYIKDIENLYSKLTNESEFEFMFFNYNKDEKNKLNLENYTKVLEYLSHRGDLKSTISLDISYDGSRVTINGINNINKYISMFSKKGNSSFLRSVISAKDKDIEIIDKIKSKENIVDIDDFFIRVRLSEEKKLKDIKKLQTIKSEHNNKIQFRFKERASLYLIDTKDTTLKIDITSVKQVNNINKLNHANPIYELELELVTTNKKKEYLNKIYEEVDMLVKVLQESNYIISNTDKEKVLSIYSSLLNIPNDRNTLDGRQPISLEIRHVLNLLPNKYAVTDKADGARNFLIIANMRVYLISSNLEVKYTGIELDKKQSKYNNSILDGEYIFLPDENRHMFMVFDCLMSCNIDIRNEQTLMKRLKVADEIINECFIFDGQKPYKYKEFAGEYDAKELIDFHRKEIIASMTAINHDIKKYTKKLLIRRKYFIPVLGISDNEIFKYSVLMWNMYMYDKNIKCPYVLDGLIYQPLEEKYITIKRDSKLSDYKWKPPNNNTIDFYIEFMRDSNGKIVYVFDNSKEDCIQNKPYVICNLYTGKKTRTGEVPVRFNEDNDGYYTYLFIDENKNVLDIEGDIVQDKTVVEFYYDTDLDTEKRIKWVPIRTRYDKTESVKRLQKKYGNESSTAMRIWNSIMYPVLYSDLEILSKDKNYFKHTKVLSQKEGKKDKKTDNVYYQLKTNLAKPMRAFHNWIKDDLIKQFSNGTIILDYACGRGGDIQKYYHGGAKRYVGVDIDYNGIYSQGDGAISRYNSLKRKFKNFPDMTFIQADGGALFTYEQQKNIISKMSNTNRKLMEENLSGKIKYDLISCQFALHYFLENRLKWNNFCENINTNLKPKGHFIATVFDADQVIKLLNDNDNFAIHYVTKDGDKQTFFEIIKKFVLKDDKIRTGNAIDVHNAWISEEGVYLTEYLTSKEFLTKQLKEKCGLKLIETKLFSEIFKEKESILKNNKEPYMKGIVDYYDQEDDINKKSMAITNLNRYYIFKKE